ncbi:Phosphatidylserine decarboxylase [hydrothermal vent metagenome]|uniref:phosphatidylserine decarboxylase n=1 Tax=hydrothermal vent metagenome TaxID=652676 RepID=A0A1W1BT60_9ZZZZ
MIFIQKIIPQHLLSNLMFKLTRWKFKGFVYPFTRWFIKTYKVDLSIAKRTKVEEYQNFNDFFTRSLKDNARPISESDFVSPVDGVVSQLGSITDNKLIQAKGKKYTLENLLVYKEKANIFSNGKFATIYLSPSDYHRIHMPYDGTLLSMTYVPGKLFSVNNKTVNNIDNLFARNERVILYFATDFGICCLILVGAIFVGSMETIWHGLITPPYGKEIKSWAYSDKKIILKKGEELGRFNMGSTVIMLFPEGVDALQNITHTQTVKMGEKI